MKTKRGKITVRPVRPKGGGVEVPAYIADGIAIHRPINDQGGIEDSWWVISHVATGTTVRPYKVRTISIARRIAQQLLEIDVDWTSDGDSLRDEQTWLAPACEQIFHGCVIPPPDGGENLPHPC